LVELKAGFLPNSKLLHKKGLLPSGQSGVWTPIPLEQHEIAVFRNLAREVFWRLRLVCHHRTKVKIVLRQSFQNRWICAIELGECQPRCIVR